MAGAMREQCACDVVSNHQHQPYGQGKTGYLGFPRMAWSGCFCYPPPSGRRARAGPWSRLLVSNFVVCS